MPMQPSPIPETFGPFRPNRTIRIPISSQFSKFFTRAILNNWSSSLSHAM